MAVTLRDVAEATGVSISTVSRVLSDSPRISEKTKIKVRRAMEELGYHPNIIARCLANQRTDTIGIVFPSSGDTAFQNPFFTEILRAISEGAHAYQYGLQFTTGKTEQEIYDNVVNMVQGQRVDGLILLYARQTDPIIAYLLALDFPFVVVGSPPSQEEAIISIDNDNRLAGEEATAYLLDKGYQQVGFIGGERSLMVTIKRLEGYYDALGKAQIPVREALVTHNDFLVEGGRKAVNQLMSLVDPPSAVVITDDLMALGVLKALHDMTIQVPEDLAIISFNNTLFCELSYPQLSSVDIHIFDLGFAAVKRLTQHIENEGETFGKVIIPHTIVIRDSC